MRGLVAGDPLGDRLDVVGGDGLAVLVAQQVLEQDLQRVRQPRHVVLRLERVEAEDLVATRRPPRGWRGRRRSLGGQPCYLALLTHARPRLRGPPALHLLRRHGHRAARSPRAARKAEARRRAPTDHDTLEAKRRGEEGWHGAVLVLVGEEVCPRGRDHYLAFGIDEEIRHRGMTPPGHLPGGARRAAASASRPIPGRAAPTASSAPVGMPFGDLDARAARRGAVELCHRHGGAARSVRDAAALRRAARRVLDHPPEREHARRGTRSAPQRRVPALGGLDAHQFGKRIGPRADAADGLPALLPPAARTHCAMAPSGELGTTGRSTTPCARGALHRDRRARAARAASVLGRRTEGDVPMGAEAPARALQAPRRAADARAAAHAARRRGDRRARGACAGDRRGRARRVPRRGAGSSATARERTWVLSNPIYFR